MKKYVIFSSCIGGMGGGQMYVRNKLLYLRENGWRVNIFSMPTGDIVIPELKEFKEDDYLPVFPMHYYSKRKRHQVINRLLNQIVDDTYEEIVVETNSINGSTWAEELSSMIGAKHLSYPLGEGFVIANKGMQQLLIFKHRRRELVGITDTSLQQMFAPFHQIEKGESYKIPAWCNNVEADVDSPFIDKIDKNKYDYIVGCLSRLSKNFILPAIKDFCNYTKHYKNQRFLLLLIGDSMENSTAGEEIGKLLESVKDNVELLITGYMYPVPTRLLEKCDAFFTSAGSGWVCMRSGVPTIVYDGNDLKPIGILGRTTQSCLFRKENEPVQDFSDLMKKILVDKEFAKMEPSYKGGLPDFKDHFLFLLQSEPKKEYYDVESIHIETQEEKIHRAAIMIIGERMYIQVLRLKSRIWK